MEVKPGYKRTDVGVIPEEWEVKRLGELGTIVRGGSPRPAGDSRYFNGRFVPWLTVASMTNLPEHQLTVTETIGFLTEAGSRLSRTLVDGTVIIANSGATLGIAKILGVTCCANDGVAAIVNQRAGEKRFLCYYVNTQTKRLREAVATGNGQPNLNTGLIREIAVPFPSSSEQHAIASVLGDVDALLDGLNRIIAKKRNLMQAALQQLLTGQIRLPGFDKEWKMRRLGEVAEVVKGRGLSKRDVTDSGTRPCILYGELFTHYGRTIACVHGRTNSSQGCISAEGDVLMPGSTTTSGVDLATASALLQGGVALGGDINVIRKRANVYNSTFLAFHLSTVQRRQIAELAQGITIHHLYGKDLASLTFRLPPLREQNAIAAVLSDMYAELSALEARRDKTRLLRHAMVQELFTGRTRLG